MTTAKPRAIFIPLGPPKRLPTNNNTRVRAVSKKAVRRTFIVVSPVAPSATILSRPLILLDSRCRGRLFGLARSAPALETHGILAAVAFDADVIARQHLAFENLEGQRILNQPLNGPSQRPRAEGRIVTFLEQQFAGFRRQLQGDLAVGQELLHALEEKF